MKYQMNSIYSLVTSNSYPEEFNVPVPEYPFGFDGLSKFFSGKRVELDYGQRIRISWISENLRFPDFVLGLPMGWILVSKPVKEALEQAIGGDGFYQFVKPSFTSESQSCSQMGYMCLNVLTQLECIPTDQRSVLLEDDGSVRSVLMGANFKLRNLNRLHFLFRPKEFCFLVMVPPVLRKVLLNKNFGGYELDQYDCADEA